MLNTFKDTSRKLGVKFEAINVKAGQYDHHKAVSQLESAIRKAAEVEGCNICLVVLPKNMKTQYKKLKKTALVDQKIVCQMTTETTLGKKNLRSIATKILLQIIAKRGNTLWVPKVSKDIGSLMMMAFETAKAGHKTTLGMCATLNSTFSSIFSRADTYEQDDKRFLTMTRVSMKAV